MRSRQRILGNKVAALSSENIMRKAFEARSLIQRVLQNKEPYLDPLHFMEQLHNAELIQLEIVEFEELPNEYAITIPSQRIIKLRADTHESASKGESRGRFTVAHELGHLILHSNTMPQFAFSQAPSNHPYQEDVEWQANEFAGWLLVDPTYTHLLKTPRACSIGFGVSLDTARYMLEKIKRCRG
ncbi:TPA: ImmA/IrrE family metallo-endopeptidase [Raoultella terrigena]|uniref:ImmA/IrrE family metallo-endopeptidase n=1 Tax=Klebsiella pneumoniae TaxID=573 RepID=UPI001FADAF9C|nr:ImmA/IrrE family metallo-endopeptidase [Klebsiella pneumoniae]MCI7949278.1 ImmA/IrrE family metallo-endopeptidase [Klebsiella pneumoniae]